MSSTGPIQNSCDLEMDGPELNEINVLNADASQNVLENGQTVLLCCSDSNPPSSEGLNSFGNKLPCLSFSLQVAQEGSENMVSGYIINNSFQFMIQGTTVLDMNDVAADQNVDLAQTFLHFNSSSNENEEISDAQLSQCITRNVGTESETIDADSQFCKTCGMLFKTSASYKKHMATHMYDKPFKCSRCPESFNYEYNLIPHESTHNVDNPYCAICNKTFSRVAGFRAHVQIHMGEDTVYCPECLEEFITFRELEAHRLEHKNGFKKKCATKVLLSCSHCESKFISRAHLKEHIRGAHKIKFPQKIIRRKKCYTCEVCGKRFEKPSQLERHNRIHTGEKPFQCHECKRCFAQKGTLKIHMVKHSGLRAFVCEHCHNKFSQKGNLQAHILRMHPDINDKTRNFTCQHCTCVFRSLVSLRNHLTKYHKHYERTTAEKTEVGEAQPEPSNKENEGKTTENDAELRSLQKPPEKQRIEGKSHSCSFCQKAFKRPSDLLRHIRTHTRDKPFICNICSRPFAVSSALTSHMRSHTGEKNYICDTCSKPFASSSNLHKHKKIHLKSIPSEKRSEEIRTGAETTLLDGVDLENAKITIPEKDLIELVPDEVTKPVEAVQEADRRYKCELCYQSFKKQSHCKAHQRVHTGERPFNCKICQRMFSTKSALINHVKTHEGNRFTCNECGDVVSSARSLKRHMEIHVPGFTYKCEICFRPFKTKAAYQKHLSLHKKNQEKLVVDEVIVEKSQVALQSDWNELLKSLEHGQRLNLTAIGENITFDLNKAGSTQVQISEIDMRNQLFNGADQGFDGCVFLQNNRIEENPLSDSLAPNLTSIVAKPQANVHSCDICNSVFNNLVELSIHKTTHLQDKRTESRQIAPRLYSEKEDVGFLEESDTGRKVENVCGFCGDNFDNKLNLEIHLKNNHVVEKWNSSGMGIAPNPDEVAVQSNNTLIKKGTSEGKKKRVEWKLQQPAARRLTEEERQVMIATEPTSVSEKVLLQLLKNEKKDETAPKSNQVHPNACEYCTKSFRKPCDLVRHLRIHTGERPYQCSWCNKSFTVKSTADRHVICHRRERSFECHICSKLFTTENSLKVHMRLHIGSKPFSCNICSATFRTSGHKIAHMLVHKKRKEEVDNSKKTVSKKNKGVTSKKHELIESPSQKHDEIYVIPSQTQTEQLNQQFILKEVKSTDVLDEGGPAARFVVTLNDDISYTTTNITELLNDSEICENERPKMELDILGFTEKDDGGDHVLDIDMLVLPESPAKLQKISCDLCEREFENQEELDNHVETDHMREPLECMKCDHKFDSKPDLDVHMLVHELDQWSCPSCSLEFPNQDELRRHKCTTDSNKSVSTPSLDLSSVVNDFLFFSPV